MVNNLPFTFYSNYALVLKSYLCPYVYLVLVIRSCPTLCNSVDCSPPGSSARGILQARILEWVAIPFPKGSSWPREWTWVSCTAGRFPITWATREAPTVEQPRRNHLEIKFFRSCHSWYLLFSVISPLWLSSTKSWEDVSVLPVKFIKSCICCFWFW